MKKKGFKKWNGAETNELLAAILKIKTVDEARRFFRDLCTEDELIDMADRFQAAKLLAQGYDQRDVADHVNMSTTTVSRVNHWLNQGEGGYQLILKRIGVIK